MTLRPIVIPIALLIPMAFSTGGCGGNNSQASPPMARAGAGVPDSLVGTVRLTGSEPAVMVTLQPERGRAVYLVGSYGSEIERLSGAVIAVRGRLESGRRPTFAVTDYEVVSVNGVRPTVGVLVQRDGAYWIEGRDTVRLANLVEGLRDQVGAKVWVVGQLGEDGLQPQSYGVIREP